ncbi:MAG TPA: hypothetical protein VNN80_16330 [Polyangiaceae bacterium]|nr:hypothetical protein [Polyangiaceae bacterium]
MAYAVARRLSVTLLSPLDLVSPMFDQLFESFRKASESSAFGQQQLFKQWLQQWPGAPNTGPSPYAEWPQSLQKQWLDSLGELLNRQRELADSTYRKGAQLLEQASRASDSKSPDEYRRLLEDVWRAISDSLKEQTEANVRELQKATQRWLDIAPKSQA